MLRKFQELEESDQQMIDQYILSDDVKMTIKLIIDKMNISFKNAFAIYDERYDYLLRQGFNQLNEEERQEIDSLILDGKILLGMQLIKDKTNMRLKDAMETYYDRYEVLRTTQLEKFKEQNSEKYWAGFYS